MPRQRGNGAACRGKRSAQHSGPGSPEELAACLEYDANGNLTKVAYSNGLTTAYEYNAVNALTRERITDRNGAVVAEYAYTVGRAGERLGASESGRSGTRTVTYAYDAAGNRVSRTVDGVTTNYTYNALNQLTAETGTTYGYDGNGNRTQKAAGDRTTTYVYDGFNRLVRATVQEGANVAVEEYVYDWKGNRIRKSREGNTVRYLVDTNNWISHVVAETDGSGTLRAFYTRGGDSLIAMDRGGTKSWYLYDGHGSVRMLASDTGQTTDTWTYDAWGDTTSRTGVTENDYLYAGERFDRTTELYQLRARYMDPKTGTFLSLDPHQGNRHDPASLHKYMYANANPVNNVDPTGLTSIAEMSGAMAGQGILAGANGLNFWTVLGALKGAAYGVQFACSMRSLIVAAVTGDAGEFLLALSNGIVSFVGLIGICETHFAVQILTKALAAYGVKENGEKFLNAVKKGDAAEILVSGLNLTMDIVTLFSSCFDGDTPVATETGFRRIDEIRAGDRVWSYNVETGERALKEVKEVFVRENDELLHIETSRGVVDATTNHPFYVVGKGWVAAGDLAVGDSIQAISGDAGVVTGLRLEKLDQPIPVYNLEVEDFHSYFVGSGVLVHNYKDDIKEFRAIAKQEGVDVNAFSDAVHAYKDGLSLPKGAKLSKKKLRELARDVKNGQWF